MGSSRQEETPGFSEDKRFCSRRWQEVNVRVIKVCVWETGCEAVSQEPGPCGTPCLAPGGGAKAMG